MLPQCRRRLINMTQCSNSRRRAHGRTSPNTWRPNTMKSAHGSCYFSEKATKSMKIDPNRFNGLYGAGRAAELIGEHGKSRRYYAQFMKNCASSQSQRPEL